MELFTVKAIKKFIDYKWPITKEYTIKKLFIPFLLYLVTYVIYMSGVYVYK